jgi:hypothetical protein
MEGEKQPLPKPFRWQTVRGEPRTVAGRRLTPVARLISYSRGRGTLRQRSLSGWALGFVRVMPLGVVVETGGQEEWVPVHDATAAALRRTVLIAAAITLLLAAVRQLARLRCQPAPETTEAG